MPPVRTTSTHKLAQRTERSHEENQERAYIAASRRSDRSLEARVESARRASEIHKKRTGRALRVREEDVLNEEMYEEEDDELSQQMRRMNALHPGFTSFSDRLNSYMAGHLGIRSALQQAIMQANQYNAQQLINPMMQANGISSPQSATTPYSNVPQSPWAFNHLQNRPNVHGRSASIATPQELSTYQHSPANMDDRRTSLPSQSVPQNGLQSPSLSQPDSTDSSNPSTPHGQYLSRPCKSPLQVPTPPQSHRSIPQHGLKCLNTSAPSAQQSYNHSPNSQLAPLTTQLPVETQQLFAGSQQTFNQTFFPGQLPASDNSSPRGSYSYHPNGKPKSHANNFNTDKDSFDVGLSQTLSPANLDQKYPTSFPDLYPSAFAPLDLGSNMFQQDPFHDLGIVSDSEFSFGYDQHDLGSGCGSDSGTYHSGNMTPGINGEPAWNPDDFLNFGTSE